MMYEPHTFNIIYDSSASKILTMEEKKRIATISKSNIIAIFLGYYERIIN